MGHAKSICLNFGIAEEYDGACHLRFDDTDPTKEDARYEQSIQEDVRWLGFDWKDNLFHASDYFDQMYDYAVELIKSGKAYVCELNEEEIREYRGTVTSPGRLSPCAKRSVGENLDLFCRMKSSEFPDGSYVLCARIDMASPNMKMRDPLLYRIRHAHHYKAADKWCIYPMYDYAHPISDAIEGIAHSICTLEFENNRELYDWVLNNIHAKFPYKPRQYEFARLDLQYTVMSKRKFLQLVENKLVNGWNDPRLPTLAGLRRGDARPNQSKNFVSLLELQNQIVQLRWDNFLESPPKDFFRLAPGREVRLRYGYCITCTHVDKDDSTGEIIAVHCTYDPETKSGGSPMGRKVKGTIHWVSSSSLIGEIRLYDRLLLEAHLGQDSDFLSHINPGSLEILTDCRLEPSLQTAMLGDRYQFERQGYFFVDPVDSKTGNLVFNRIVTLKDSWSKKQPKS